MIYNTTNSLVRDFALFKTNFHFALNKQEQIASMGSGHNMARVINQK